MDCAGLAAGAARLPRTMGASPGGVNDDSRGTRPPCRGGTRWRRGSRGLDQLRVLRGLGYESVQGYLTGAPAPLIDLRDIINHHRVELPT